MAKNADKDNVKDCMEKFVNIDGKEYKFNIPVYGIELDDLSTDNKKLQQIFSAFDDENKRLSTFELKNIFATFQNMDVTGKNQKADNILSDDEIQQAISNNEKLKDFSVKDIKLFIKTLVQANNKKINEHKKYAKYVAEGIYEQISGPSLNKNTIKKLKNIDSTNAYYVLTEYEKMAQEPLVQALGEEWNFSVTNIKYYVLKPLVNQASWLGIEVSEDYYQNENNVKKLNTLAKTLCSAIKKELDNPKFNRNGKSATKLSNPDNKKTEQKTEKKDPPLCKEKPKDIAKQLFDQISGASLNKNTIALLKKIGKNNAAQVIDEYKKIAGQNLADAINEEWGLDIKTIKQYICEPLIEQAKELNMYYINSAEENYNDMTSMESINKFINKWSSGIIEVMDYRKDIPKKINFNDYKLDALKKKYPDKECRQMGNIILINNQNGTPFMEIKKEDDGKLRIYDKYNKDKYARTICYNADGTLDFFSTDNVWEGYKTDNENPKKDKLETKVNEIFEDIYYKIGGVIPATRKSLKENIEQIKSENILEIMALYQNKTGESLYDAINGEIGLADSRKPLIEHLNSTLNMAFTNLADKDVINVMSDFKRNTDLSLLESVSKMSGMPKDKKQVFMDKFNIKLQKFVNGINADNIEETLKKYQRYQCFGITEMIGKDSGLSASVRKTYIKHITDTLSSHIADMSLYEYMSDRVKTGYDDIKQPTLTEIILKEKGLTGEEKVKLIRQIENRIMNEYLFSETEKDDIKKLIETELNKIAKNPDNASAEFIDKLNCKLYKRDLYALSDDSKEIKAPNGKIDSITYQGGTGDCWLLAPINAIARSKKGLDMLNSSLKVNADGGVTVYLNGVNKSYTISKKDLYSAKDLSTGDLDVRAIEIAVERYMMEYKKDDINGDTEQVAYDILIGGNKKVWYWNGTKLDDTYKSKINNPDILITASISNKEKLSKGVTTTDGQEIHANHVYTVVKADDKYVFLINPWNNGELLKLSYAEFKSIFDQFTELEI